MKKIITSIISCIFCALPFFAMPGFKPYIPDNSGSYVYYKDNSFTRESYIGILYYDESTIQIRYAAPQSKDLALPQKEISLLISLNPEKDYLEMTGERIITDFMPNEEDTDIINYLHDILYEFTSRRSKVDNLNDQEVKITQDYAQFGGNCMIVYDSKVPLYNVKRIENGKGETIFICATFGQLSSSNDKSFSQFYGFPDIPPQPIVITPNIPGIKKPKTPKSKRYHFENQYLTLDENWEQKMDNFWTLGNDSLVTVSQIPVSNENRVQNEVFILRKLLESSEGIYTNLLKTEISYNERKCQYKIRSVIYQQQKNANVQNTKLLTSQQPKKGFISESSTKFDYFSISTYEEAYNKTPSYFEKIVKSYKVN